jgi:hypothetical protein
MRWWEWGTRGLRRSPACAARARGHNSPSSSLLQANIRHNGEKRWWWQTQLRKLFSGAGKRPPR